MYSQERLTSVSLKGDKQEEKTEFDTAAPWSRSYQLGFTEAPNGTAILGDFLQFVCLITNLCVCVCVCVCSVSQSCPPLYNLWTIVRQAPLSMEFSMQEYWFGLLFLPPGDLPDPGLEPASPALQADSLPLSQWRKPGEVLVVVV